MADGRLDASVYWQSPSLSASMRAFETCDAKRINDAKLTQVRMKCLDWVGKSDEDLGRLADVDEAHGRVRLPHLRRRIPKDQNGHRDTED